MLRGPTCTSRNPFVQFDLKNAAEQRIQALKLLWALSSYMANGKAKVNIVAAEVDASSA